MPSRLDLEYVELQARLGGDSEFEDPLFVHRQGPLKPLTHFFPHFGKIFMAGVLVEDTAKSFALVIEVIHGSDLFWISCSYTSLITPLLAPNDLDSTPM